MDSARKNARKGLFACLFMSPDAQKQTPGSFQWFLVHGGAVDHRHATWRPVIGRFAVLSPRSSAAGCMDPARDTWRHRVGRFRVRGLQERRSGAWVRRGGHVSVVYWVALCERSTESPRGCMDPAHGHVAACHWRVHEAQRTGAQAGASGRMRDKQSGGACPHLRPVTWVGRVGPRD